jgi:hypothetical protein
MEIKGISVKSIPDFVQKNYSLRYNEWLDELPNESKKIMKGYIFVNNWYPLNESLTIPIKTIARMFYENDIRKTAWTMGRFSAQVALTGVYKLFVQFGSPNFIIDRASRVMSSYFQPSELLVVESSKNYMRVHITLFSDIDEAVEYNIAGWIEKALEISGCRNIQIEISKSLTKGDEVSEFLINWV